MSNSLQLDPNFVYSISLCGVSTGALAQVVTVANPMNGEITVTDDSGRFSILGPKYAGEECWYLDNNRLVEIRDDGSCLVITRSSLTSSVVLAKGVTMNWGGRPFFTSPEDTRWSTIPHRFTPERQVDYFFSTCSGDKCLQLCFKVAQTQQLHGVQWYSNSDPANNNPPTLDPTGTYLRCSTTPPSPPKGSRWYSAVSLEGHDG